MEKKWKQAQLGVPHSRIQVELGFILQAGTCQILNFAQNPRQSQSVQGTELNLGGGTPHRKSVYIFSEQGTNRGWGHRTYFLNRANKGGDTAYQNSVPVQITSSVDGWVGGWVGGWSSDYRTTSWLHLAS